MKITCKNIHDSSQRIPVAIYNRICKEENAGTLSLRGPKNVDYSTESDYAIFFIKGTVTKRLNDYKKQRKPLLSGKGETS